MVDHNSILIALLLHWASSPYSDSHLCTAWFRTVLVCRFIKQQDSHHLKGKEVIFAYFNVMVSIVFTAGLIEF